jgi:hypothetical protein
VSQILNKPTLFSGAYADLTSKPTIPDAQVSADWTATTGVSQVLNKPTLFSGAYANLTGAPTLFSGAYADLTSKPTIPAAQISADWTATTGVSQVLNKPTLFSGAYADLTGITPTWDQSTTGNASTATKLAATKTINGVAFDGSKNITITSVADAGTISGTIAVVNGGTGLTASGTDGQVLTSTSSGTLTWTNASSGSAITVGTILSTSNVNGASITDGVLKLGIADQTNGGILTISSQRIAGAKTFLNDIVVNSLALGNGPGEIPTNTVLGKYALKLNTTGNKNTAVGESALAHNINGNFNTSIGFESDVVSSSYSDATAIGARAMVGASNSTAIGAGARVITSNTIQLGDEYVNKVNTSGNITASGGFTGSLTGNVTTSSTGKILAGPTSGSSASAIVEANSTTKGFLPPRMTGLQRDAIVSPASGLIIYCNNCGVAGGEPQFFNGSAWVNMIGGVASSVSTLQLGEVYEGGKIFYIFQSYDPGYILGEVHGLIVSPADLPLATWGNSGLIDQTSNLLATGHTNTTRIIGFSSFITSVHAARKASDLIINIKDDWFLPSENELKKLFLNISLITGGGYSGLINTIGYWTSTEVNISQAISFTPSGSSQTDSKIVSRWVRAIRAF